MVYPEEDRSLEHHNGGNAEHENAVQGFVADEQHAGEDARAAADERPEKQRALRHALPASRRGELVLNTDDSADHADCDEVV